MQDRWDEFLAWVTEVLDKLYDHAEPNAGYPIIRIQTSGEEPYDDFFVPTTVTELAKRLITEFEEQYNHDYKITDLRLLWVSEDHTMIPGDLDQIAADVWKDQKCQNEESDEDN